MDSGNLDGFKKPKFAALQISRPPTKNVNIDVTEVEAEVCSSIVEPDSKDNSMRFQSASDLSYQSKSIHEDPHVSIHRVEQSKGKYVAMLKQLNYKEPKGSGVFDSRYSLEVLKNGSIAEKIEFSTGKSFLVVGRIPVCDIVGEHPTLSRTHAIFQFICKNQDRNNSETDAQVLDNDTKHEKSLEDGLYIYDLKSTHGTFLNKNQLFPQRYYRLRVGHVIKFGNSSRLYVVSGPEDDKEEEDDKTVTELLKERNEKEFRRKRMSDLAHGQSDDDADDDDGNINWGMSEDAVEESGISLNPFAEDFQESKELSLDNPKRTLKNWFEREGYDLVYDVKEKSCGHFICTVTLPVDGPNGSPLIAEVDGKGRKKDIMGECALKACQLLDKYGVLRKSNQGALKRKSKDWEEKDYYSSDDDAFLDRTGSIERKRKMRMKHAGKFMKETVETFESLVQQYTRIDSEITDLEQKIKRANTLSKTDKESEVDSLEAFMLDLKGGVIDLKLMGSKVKELTEEKSRVLKLINIVKPAGSTFPPRNDPDSLPEDTSTSIGQRKTMKIMFGPRKGISSTVKKTVTVVKAPCTAKPKSNPNPLLVDVSEETPSGSEGENSLQMTSIPSKLAPSPDPIPLLPHNLSDEEERLTEAPPKPKKQRTRPQKKEVSYEYDNNNPDYSVWVPPVNQAGDGKTNLNEKFGY